MSNFELADLITLSTNFPESPEPEIIRDNYLDTIEKSFHSNQIILIRGDSGVGKTILLAQYARKHPNNSFPIFINPVSRTSYDPKSIEIELSNQIYWYLNQKEIDYSDEIDVSADYNSLLWKLKRESKKKREEIFFVIDGLLSIREQDNHYIDLILNLFPIGDTNNFNFLFSGNDEQLLSKYVQSISLQKFFLHGFSLSETGKFFSAYDLETSDISRINEITKKPSQLACIYRLLKETTVDELFDVLPKEISNIFEVEWRRLNVNDEELLLCLAILTFSSFNENLQSLAEYLNLTENQIRKKLSSINFVVIKTNNDIYFIDEAFRKFAETKLQQYKDKSNEIIINKLYSTPHEDDAIRYLPEMLMSSGKFTQLLDFLSPEIYLKLLDSTESLQIVKNIVESGFKASENLQRNDDLYKFSFEKSIIAQFEDIHINSGKIRTLALLNDIPNAIKLIEGVSTKAEKLFLYAILANSITETRDIKEFEIEEKIKLLYSQIDPESLRDNAVDLAAELLTVDPELAFDLINKTTNIEAEENSLDIAYTKLYIKAIIENPYAQDTTTSNLLNSIKEKISDNHFVKFSEKIFLVSSSCSGKRLISEINEIANLTEKLFLIQIWLKNNRERYDTLEVIEYSINQIIRTSEYSPNAQVFRDLATPLPYCENNKKLQKVVGLLDTQRMNIESIGPTEDYIIFELLLAVTEHKYNQ